MSMLFKRIKDWATSITAFRAGDVIPVDGPSGTAKMSNDDLLLETAKNALAGNVAPAFDDTKDYVAGDVVEYGGKIYSFNTNHSAGAWNSSDVDAANVEELFVKKTFIEEQIGKIIVKNIGSNSVNLLTTFKAGENILLTAEVENGENLNVTISGTIGRSGTTPIYPTISIKKGFGFIVVGQDLLDGKAGNLGSFGGEIVNAYKVIYRVIHLTDLTTSLFNRVEEISDYSKTKTLNFGEHYGDTSVISDCNNLPVGNMSLVSGSLSHRPQYPDGTSPSVSIISVFVSRNLNFYTQICQSIKDSNGNTSNESWMRCHNGTTSEWSDWKRFATSADLADLETRISELIPTDLYVGFGYDGVTKFTYFAQAIRKASQLDGHKRIHVMGGTYNMLSELGGDTFLASFDDATGWNTSNYLLSDTEIIGEGKVIVQYKPTAEQIEAHPKANDYFSVLNPVGNFRCENLDIDCQYCRYGIHDEVSDDTANRYTKKEYKNVRVTMGPTLAYGQALGGGLSFGQRYYFDNCEFRTSNYAIALSYHNRYSRGANFTFRNCRFYNTHNSQTACVRFGSVQDNGVCDVNFSGCYFNKNILLAMENNKIPSTQAFQLYINNSNAVTVDVDAGLSPNPLTPVIVNTIS